MKRNNWLTAILVTAFVGSGITPTLFAQPASVPTTRWPLDTVILANGAKLEGLVIEESPSGIRFKLIRRAPGRPTITLTCFFHPNEFASIQRMSDSDRAWLKLKLQELDPTGSTERQRTEAVRLTAVEWLGKEKGAKRYEADHFILESAASEEVTRRAAVRLEQIYAAFERFLPPRREMGRPTRVQLAGDLDQYKELLKQTGRPVLNPAVFDATANRIICGTDLRRLDEEILRTRLHHLQQLAEAEKTERELREMYKSNKPELDRFLATLARERGRINAAEADNDRAFDNATRRVFAMLYHEAFHSYVMNYVYPALTPAEIQEKKGTGELPRWLNEGMAQMFEHPLVEAGELRVETPDPTRLKRVHNWLAARSRGRTTTDGLIPLKDLLRTGKNEFLTGHAMQQAESDRNYLSSWALAYYLTFERRIIGTKAFEKYLTAINTGGNHETAFLELIGQQWDAFEKEWHRYLQRLKEDGTLRSPNEIQSAATSK